MKNELVMPAGDQLRARAVALAEAVVACEFGRDPRLQARYGPTGRAGRRRDTVDHLLALADAVGAGSPAVFEDYVGWAKALSCQQGVSSDEMTRTLICMDEVMREQMPVPVAAAAAEVIDGACRALPSMPSEIVSFIRPEARLSSLAGEYVFALLGGYRQGASELVFDAADRGEPIADLYIHVLQPALWEVGRLWQMQKISIAQEHFCSAATQVVMSQLLLRGSRRADAGRRVVIASVSGDRHDIGARMLADFFDWAGWDSYCCGADTPHDEVVRAAVARRADVVAISASIVRHVHAVQEAVRRLRAEPRCAGLRVMVGGHPFRIDPALWRKVGADGTAADAVEAVPTAERWMAASAEGA